jgi:alpha-tubulin suppressor-like RCC1 family protein
MKNRKIFLPALLSIALVFSLILPASVIARGQVTPMVAAGDVYTVGLKANGKVIAVGDNDDGQCNVGGWRGITQVAAGSAHTVGLKANGRVVAVGWNDYGQCDVGGWTDITQLAAGLDYTVGLKADGTVVAAGVCFKTELAKWNLVLVVPSVNWALIGGIISVVVAVGLVIFFMLRRRAAQTKGS